MPTRSSTHTAGSGGPQKGKSPAVQHKLRKLGLEGGRSPAKSKQVTFEIFFPRPPYYGAQYRAARGKDALYNFVGLVLGHGGATIQRIQKASGAKIEVRDSAGNLNGAHPSSHGDPSLHAWVSAGSRQRLDKAVQLLLEVLQPTNTTLSAVTIVPGGSVVLGPVIPSHWPEAAAAAAASAAAQGQDAAPAPSSPLASSQPAPPATNAWATNRLLKQHQNARQFSPVSSLQRTQGTSGSGASSSTELSESGGGAGDGSSDGIDGVEPALPAPPSPQPPQAEQQPMATVWATGLHPVGSLETPATPSASVERLVNPEFSASFNSSWSLWDSSSSSTGSTFYQQLQAAASSSFSGLGSGSLPGLGSGSMPISAASSSSSGSGFFQHHPHQHMSMPLPPQAPLPPQHLAGAGPASLPAPFPGLGAGLSLGLSRPLSSHSAAAGGVETAEYEMAQLLAAVASMATHDS